MINNKFLVVSNDLKEQYEEALNSHNEKNMFKFLKKYLKWIEGDDKPYNRLFLIKNPLKMKNDKVFNKEFNYSIIQFLNKMINNNFSDKRMSKKYKGLAHTYLGIGYEFGIFNCRKSPTDAFNKYKLAAQIGDPLGTFRLAQCFEKGIGVSISQEQALSFYRCAAKLGLTDAVHTYGIIMMYGYCGATKDQNTGYYYMKIAAKKADKNCPFPLYDLGMFYENGTNDCGVNEDYKYAYENFYRGAKLGDPNCKFKLGQCHEFGDLNVKKDREKSIKYYKSAAEYGCVEAQYLISEYYLTGKLRILKKSYEKSFFWTLRGATKGHSGCAFNCGEYTLTGTGTEKDLLGALFWFEISNVLGHSDAKEKIDQLQIQIAKKDAGAEIPAACCFCLFG